MGTGDPGVGGSGMKIAFVSEYPVAPDRIVGGVQACVHRLATAMARRPDLEIHAVSLELGRLRSHEETMEGVRVHRFPMPRRFGNVTLGWAERRDTAAALRRIRPDIAHAHVLGPPVLGTADAGFPWVATAHGIQAACGRLLQGWAGRVRAWSYATMERASLRRLQHLIVINPYVRETFGDALVHATLHEIENPVDDRFFAIREPGDPRRILVSGRVTPAKDPGTLLEAAGILAREGARFTIEFAGPADEPAFVEGLRSRAKALGIDEAVRFSGSLAPDALAEAMGRAGILVSPSRQETASLAIMEAMAAGRAVIASQAGGNRHLVRAGDTGWIVPVGDGPALAAAMRESFANPEATRARGRRGREVALARFRAEPVVEKTLEVYREILAESRAEAA